MADKPKKPEKKKQFEDQMDDEEVLLVFRKHPIVMRKGLVLAMFAILLGNVPALFIPEYVVFFGGLIGGFILALLVFLPSWIAWWFSVYIITDQRLIQLTQKGLFHRSVVDLSLKQIQSINYQVNGIQETLLGFGTILIQTYIGDLVIHDVHHPGKITRELNDVLREYQGDAVPYPAEQEMEYDEKKA